MKAHYLEHRGGVLEEGQPVPSPRHTGLG